MMDRKTRVWARKEICWDKNAVANQFFKKLKVEGCTNTTMDLDAEAEADHSSMD